MNKTVGQYDRFKAIAFYHSAIGQLFWAIEQAVLNGPGYQDWDDDYVRQCVRDVLHAHLAMTAAHIEVA